MKIALITTTINVPEVLRTYVANVPSDCTLDLVVSGDTKTPSKARDLIEDLGGTYLGVDGEKVERWETHRTVGLHTIQRRNIALLHALTLGPDIVVTVDDDNVPENPATYFIDITKLLACESSEVTSSSTGWFNPGSLLKPSVTHRGFPLDQRHVPAAYTDRDLRRPGERWRVGVVAGLTLGDPDVDAIERIVNRPTTDYLHDEVTLDVGTWAPFNTQNTAYAWEVAPLMQCLYAVGRYDDILMSYYARLVMDELGWHVHYGAPVTRSVRNEHDLVTDLERELYGYRFTPELVARLRNLTLNLDDLTLDPLDLLEAAYSLTESRHKYQTIHANAAWIRDARLAVREGNDRRRERRDV